MKLSKILSISVFVLFSLSTIWVSAQCGGPPDPCDGLTYTQGAYGAGNNNTASQYLNAHFSSAFPNGLTIGCSGHYLTLTTPSAIAAFLPSGTTPTSLPSGTLTNPGGSYSNVFAGQLVTLILNNTFDATDPNFSPSSTPLGNHTITTSPFTGMTVNAFITLANSIIGGCTSQYSYSQMNNMADYINNNYDDGTTSNGFLGCPNPCSSLSLTALSGSISCFGGSTNVTITASGGNTPYSGTGVFTVSAGANTYSVTDAVGCAATIGINLSQPSQLVLSKSTGSILCYGGTTTATISASGGTSPYTGTGIFTVGTGPNNYTVTDNKGCKATTSFTLPQPSQLVASSSAGNINCYAGTTTATISASGGTSPYTGTGVYTVSAGASNYTVTDNKGCKATTGFTLTQPPQLTASSVVGTINCYGGTATATISASGGTSPYTGTGTYTVSAGASNYTVTDNKGCKATTGFTLTQPSQLVAVASCGSVSCNGGNTTVTIGASGGTAPYTGTGTFTATAGARTYTVTDAKGCTATASVNISQPSILNVSASSGTILCYGGTTTVNVTANGGTAPYTGTGVFTVSAGSYTYNVTDSHGCSGTVTVTITQPSQLVAVSSCGSVSCNGGTATITIGASGGAAPYSGTGTFTATAGAHTYTVTDGNGCIATTSVNISQPSQLNVSATSGTILCYSGTTTVNISATGGTSPYTGTGVFTVSAGSYTYNVTDSHGCSGTVTITITQPSQLLAVSSCGSVSCNGGTATITIGASGGTAPYTGTGTFTTTAGAHSYTVTDAKGCTATTSVNISQPSVLNVSASSGTILCYGGTTTVNITASGGTSPYTGTGIFTVTAGIYTYNVTDSHGCSGTVTVTITQPSQLLAVSSCGSVSCNGGIATITIGASGGTAPYSGTGTFTANAGSHTYTVTDANGCIATTSVNISQPSVLNVSASSGTILCYGGTTTVNISAAGGTSPYTGTGVFTVSAGSYTYNVTDSHGCSGTVTITITQPSQLLAVSSCGSVSCNGGTATITIGASGGTAPYVGTGTFTTTAGAHSYTVTDAKGCTATTSVNISQPSVLNVSASSGTILCYGATATINISASGGTSPYTGTGVFTVTAGTYTYNVTDSHGCSGTVTVTITQPSQLIAVGSCGSVSCNGGTATITIGASGGTAPYSGTGTFTANAGSHTYTVTDANGCIATTSVNISQPSVLNVSASSGTILCYGGTTTVNISASGGSAPYNGTGVFTVSAGSYTCNVTDSHGCSGTATITITQPSQLLAVSSCGSVSCNGGTATITIGASGGTSPYSGTGTFTANAGLHTYTVTDANGCTATTSVNISQPSQLNVSESHGNVLCNGGTTTVNVTANGGTAPYTGTGVFTVSAGSYTYNVTDSKGCSGTVTVTITQPSQLIASASNGTILCNGGTATVNVTATGGTSPYTGTGIFTVNAGVYSYTVTDANGCKSIVTGTISQPSLLTASSSQGTIACGGTTTVNVIANGGTSPYTGTGIFTVSAGPYSFTVTDANGCKATISGTITQPSQLIATSSSGNIFCNGGTTTVNVTATGGTSPYAGTGIFTVTAGPYSFTVTDANGCKATTSGTITQPSSLNASSSNGNILCNGGTTTVNVTATGGTSPYTGTGIFTVTAGPYSYTVTDANGCKASVSGTITQPSQLNASASNGAILCNGGTTTVNVTATGGTSPYSGTGVYTVTAGPYSYTVTDANGCKAIVSGTITQPSQLNASAAQGTVACGGTTTVNISATGGTSPYTGTGIFTVNAGPYSYTVTDANGCNAVVSGTITQLTQLVASSNNGAILCNGGTTTVNVTATGGTSPYTGTGVFTVNAGPYSFTVTDANGCKAVTNGTIGQPSLLNASSSNGNILCNGGTTTVNITATGGNSPYTGTGIFTVNAGPYSYTVTDANGCKAVVNGTISQPSSLNVSASNGNILCNGGTTTVNVTATGGTSPYTGTGVFTVSAGPYSYTVTDANGCKAIVTGTITQPTALNSSATQGTVACGGTTTINISATGGTSPYTGTGIFTVNAGPYSFTVTDANGCKAVVNGTVTQLSQLIASAVNGSILCNGGTTTVNVSATGGTSPYTGTGIHTVSAGPYSFTVSDANNCTAVVTGTVTQPSQLNASASAGTILCNGGTTTLNVTASGGTSPYTGTGTFTVNAGPYSYTVTDANGCEAVVSGTITQPSQLNASASNGIILCNGGTTTVNITASGGIAPYTNAGTHTVFAGPYSFTVTDANGCKAIVSGTISQPSQLSASATQGTVACGGTTTVNITAAGGTSPYTGTGIFTVNAGPYTFTVADANGCITTVTGTISQFTQLNASATTGTILCNGGTTTINITAAGGTAPYTGTGIFTLAAGPYSFTVTDVNGCKAFVTGNLAQPSQLTASAVTGTILCNGGTTTINVTATGGTLPYTGTGTFTANAGPYSYTVTDANGCKAFVSGTITQPSQLTVSASNGIILCNGGTTTVNVVAAGGTAPYTNTGTHTVSAGPYSFTVTDTNGCFAVVSGTISQPSQLNASATQGTVACGGTTTVNITATGGTSPYTGTGIFTVNAGPYSFTVTDANGCKTIVSGTISQFSQLNASASTGTILCNGGTTTINITATGGTAPYTGTGIFTLTAGPYSFTVTDANGCKAFVNGNIAQPTQLIATAANGTILCNGGTTTVNVTGIGGTAPYTGTGTFTVSAGPYSYTVTDANGCKATISGTVTQPSQLNASVSSGTILCNGGTITVDVTATGGTSPYTGTGTFTANAGAHTYTVTDANGCAVTVSVNLSQPSQLNASVAQGTVACGGTTTVNISATGGTSPYTGIGIFTVNAGPYSFTVTDANGCKAIVSGTITQFSQLNASASTGTILCNGGTTTVNVTATGGTSPYTGTGVFTVNAGPYSFTVTDANNCIAIVSGNMTQPLQLVASASTGTILCNGGTTTINVTATGGTSPYTGTGTFTANAGPYSFTVTDANGCKATVSGNLTQPTQLSAFASNGIILCNGGTTTVNIIATGGTAAYTNAGLHTVSAGPYSFTVTDSNGCSAVVNGTITQPSQLTVSAMQGTVACGGSTTVNITATGGTSPYSGTGIFTVNVGPYSFTITDANGCTATVSGTITQLSQLVASASNGTILCNGGTTTVNVTATGGTSPYTGTGTFTVFAGPYSFTVTDANNCMATVSGTITQPSQLNASATNGTILCNGGTTTISVDATGGTTPYTGTGMFTVNAGPYSYTVTDANGCKATISGNVAQPLQLNASSSNGNILCNGGTTTVNVIVTGGTVPYTNAGLHTVSAGPYSFTVTDANGCSATVSGTITQPSQLNASATQGTVACGGTTTVNITATGGTSPYTGAGIFTVSAGPYSFTVTDANGCAAVVSGTITQFSQLTANAATGTILCNGGTTTINITATGGTSPYTGTGTFSISAGPYSFTVTDANNCISIVSGNITQPSQLAASAATGTILCNGGTTTINVSATGGTAPYSGTGISTVNAGPYSFTITDSNGCSASVSGTISQPSQLSVSAMSGTILCNGGTTTVNITAAGGTAPYTNTGLHTVPAGPYSFTVSDANGCSTVISGTITQPSQLTVSATQGTVACGGTTTVNISATGGTSPYTGTGIFTVNAGPYSFTVTDANGCTAVISGTITQFSQLNASASTGTILCNGGTTTVNITATGGTSPYTGTGVFTVNAGPYSFTVTDANNCIAIVSGNITQPSQLNASASTGTILCNGGTTTLNVSATGGTAPYTGTGTFTANAGPYSFTVTDANGCTVSLSGTMTQPSQLNASATNGSVLCNGGTTTVNITATGGTAPYTNAGLHTVSAGPYSFTVTDANGCSAIVSGTTTQPSQLNASAASGTILCNGGTTTVTISATGGTAPYTGTGTFTRNAGPYSFTVTDANACTSVVNGTITQASQLTASAANGIILCNGGATTVNVTATGGAAPYTGAGTFTVNAGPYSYTVTDANLCTAIVSGTIPQPSQLTVTATSGTILCNGGTTTVNITATGGTAPYTNAGLHTVSAGPYSFTVTDANGCIAIVSGTITQPTPLNASATNGTILCNGGTTTVNVTANGGTAPYTGTGTFTANAGTHTYTVTDSNGCTITVSVNISQPSQLSASASQGTVACGGTTTINITATGGTSPYTGTGVFTVNAGPYSFTVTDANACTSIVTGTITQPSQLNIIATKGNIFCNGGTTTVNITATGGSAPYTGTGIITVSAGVQTFTVTDALGCTASTLIAISEPSAMNMTLDVDSIICNGGSTTATVTASGGISPYTGTGIFTITAGTHIFVVTDAHGCSSSSVIAVTEPDPLVVTFTGDSILCHGGVSFPSINASGGVAPYSGTGTFSATAGTHTFVVTDAAGCSYPTIVAITQPDSLIVDFVTDSILCNGGMANAIITATGGVAPYSGTGNFTFPAGTYTNFVQDANGCQAFATRNITEPAVLVANLFLDSIRCNGGLGLIVVTGSGGTTPYQGTGVYSVQAGNYNYVVSDTNGCSASTVITVPEPPPLYAGAVINYTALCYKGFASVTVFATGGSGVYLDSVYADMPCMTDSLRNLLAANGGTVPYWGPDTYTWVPAGSYTYIVVDSHCCWDTAEIVIPEPPELIGSSILGDVPCMGSQTTVTLTATGGTQPYSGLNVYSVSAGSYTYQISDANGCLDTIEVVVDTSTCTGFEEYSLTGKTPLRVYPNPNNGNFRISGIEKGKAVILSQSGQLVKDLTFEEGEEIEVADLADGMYFLVGARWRVKIVVMR